MAFISKLNNLYINWSGWRDSNSRPTAPKAVALPGCATPRNMPISKAQDNTLNENRRQLNITVFIIFFFDVLINVIADVIAMRFFID
jgi:hypothetical protein